MPSVLTADHRAALVRDLAGLLGDRCSTNATQLEHHGHGESWQAPGEPDAVVFPLSTDEVSAVVRAAARYGAPLVAFGAGSSLEGHVNPIHGGVSVDLSRMNRVLRVSAEDLDATVEAGVTHRQLNKALANTGAAFWVDPGADATIGGMAATRASGTTAVRYGTMRDVVLGLTVVLADGRVIRTGGRARKSSAGYDLTRLFVGSEGTLGVITEVTVRLFGQPEAVSAAVCAFDSIEAAVRAVIQTIQFGIPVARIELLDEVQVDAVNRYSKLSYAVKPTLLFEFHATSATGAAEHATAVQEIAAEHGGSGFRWATTTEDRATLWAARHNTYYAALAMRPGGKAWVTDVCVPISALAECIVETKRDLAASRAYAPLVGHVGDGNFHLNFVLDPADPAQVAEVKALNARLVERALRLGGTCTGEHGIGLGKQKYLLDEHGEDAVDVMRAVKAALDSRGLMNPGKIFSKQRLPGSRLPGRRRILTPVSLEGLQHASQIRGDGRDSRLGSERPRLRSPQLRAAFRQGQAGEHLGHDHRVRGAESTQLRPHQGGGRERQDAGIRVRVARRDPAHTQRRHAADHESRQPHPRHRLAVAPQPLHVLLRQRGARRRARAERQWPTQRGPGRGDGGGEAHRHLRHLAARADRQPQHQRPAADDFAADAGGREGGRRLRSVQGRPDVPVRSGRDPARVGRPGTPLQIVREGGDVVLRHEWMDVRRVIHMDMKAHPNDGKRGSLGHSIGRWDGDTLVIETANYSAGVLNQYVEQPGQPTRGLLHSAALTSVERLHFDAARQRLVVEIDLLDPEFFKQPFPRSTNEYAPSELKIEPFNCSREGVTGTIKAAQK